MADGSVFTDSETGDIVIQSGMPDVDRPAPITHDTNLAEIIDTGTLDKIGYTLTSGMAYDLSNQEARNAMLERFTVALGIGPESKPDDYEYEFSDTSDSTLLARALTSFQAKALSALMPSPEAVAIAEKDVDLEHIEDPIMRKDMLKKLDAATRRVTAFYNHYFTKELTSYVEDTDLIINDVGLNGMGIRRVVVDESFARTPVQPVYVPPEDIILSYDTKNFRGSGRFSHRHVKTTTDMIRAMRRGHFIPADIVAGFDFSNSRLSDTKDHIYGLERSMLNENGSHTLYDVFAYLFIADDPHPQLLARPYVVTIHSTSQKVLAIRRNWREGDPEERPLEHFIGYIYSPGRNAVTPVGLGALLTNMTLALRKAQRRALDAAYLANHPAGFITNAMSIRDDGAKIMPGELRPVDAANGNIRDAIMMNPFEGPNQGLLALYDRMLQAGQDLSSVSTIDFASMMKSGVAAGPALAAYDESTEFQTSVHRRLYRAHDTELGIIHEHMKRIMAGRHIQYGAGKFLLPDDLLVTKLRPAMKPGHVSRQREIIEAQTTLELASANPGEINKREAISRYLRVIGAQNIDDLMTPDPAENPVQPSDPVSEYLRLMRGEPIKAGPSQNHDAHIAAHTSQMSLIQTSSLPVQQGEAIAAMLASHIAEHEGLNLMVQVAASMGLPLEALAEGLTPEMEMQVAPLMAQAVAAIEALRKPNDGVDPRIALEQVKIEGKRMVEEIRVQSEARDQAARLEIERLRQEAETYRNDEDNRVALIIAKIKNAQAVPASAPDDPAPPDPAPRVPRQIINP